LNFNVILILRSALLARVSKGEATSGACILRDARSALLEDEGLAKDA